MKKRILFSLIIIIPTIVLAKTDFYYGFVNPDLSQVSPSQTKEIYEGNNLLKTIKDYAKDGQYDIALNHMQLFNNTNKVDILKSEATLLHAQILYESGNKTNAVLADQILEKAIHDSVVNQDDLLEAYKLMVLLKIRINKAKEAEFYANAIEHTFDDPKDKVFGQIALAQIHVKRREFRKAIKILEQELIKTNNLDVATIIADDLYDAYLLNKEDEKAHDLIIKVLEKNLNYYAKDSFKALTKVNKLLAANMPKEAIKILKELLKNTIDKESVDRYNFLLASIFMDLSGYEPKYLIMAKNLYEDLIKQKYDNPFFEQSKMYLDEIIMRQGKFDPQMVASKYSESDSMQYKAMMQELINSIADQKYEQTLRMKKVYSNIPKEILHRFGYESIDSIYENVHTMMLGYYLKTNQCQELTNVIKDVDHNSLQKLVENENDTKSLFNCMIEYPTSQNYSIAREVYKNVKNPLVQLYLEKIAIIVEKFDDALEYSQKIDLVNDGDILSQEFLYRFLIYGAQNGGYSMEKFFNYAKKNQEFITNNENNPMIIDFYYQYYLYLLKNKDDNEAINVLYKLYNKQKQMDARVYSPFVEIELAKYAKLDDNYEKSLEYLEDGLNLSRSVDGRKIERKIKKEDLAQIYYEMAKIYEYFKKENKYKTMVKKCQNLKDVDSYYKKMCDKM
ncbi:MAG: class 1 isoprenoid biosynthesis enzyme [Campylobacterales bacterium]|nr:class 1 isoprenoid biosynthesis enzyme [Campylobacterales bacterium]